MKNPAIFYGVIALGVIALAIGVYLMTSATPASPHHITKYAAIGVGVLLLIAGVVGMVMARPKAATR
jgi:uncharacterized membrane protein HdeD (DUF308 family)